MNEEEMRKRFYEEQHKQHVQKTTEDVLHLIFAIPLLIALGFIIWVIVQIM